MGGGGAAIPPAPPLQIILRKSMLSGLADTGFAYRNRLHPRDSVNRCKTTEVLKCIHLFFCHKVITLKFTLFLVPASATRLVITKAVVCVILSVG